MLLDRHMKHLKIVSLVNGLQQGGIWSIIANMNDTNNAHHLLLAQVYCCLSLVSRYSLLPTFFI